MLLRKQLKSTLRFVPRYAFSTSKPPETNKNYYELLGVEKDADKDAIKAAYKELGIFQFKITKMLARKYHPDLNPEHAVYALKS